MSKELEKIHAGHAAQSILRDLSRKIQEREESIIKSLIADYRGNKIETHKFVGGIAAIMALRSLQSDYERLVEQGNKALETAHARA